MKKRTRSRELALQFLYQVDLLGPEVMDDLTDFLRSEGSGIHGAGDQETARYARQLIEGTFDAAAELDSEIQAVAQNWQIDRMAVIDRNVLRMAAFELLHCDEIPPKVAINEAIELGKRFSTQNSGAFINGILDKIKNRKAAAPRPRTDMGLLDRFKERLTKTRSAISDGLSGLFRGGRKIDQGLLDELEELLYTSDLGPLAGELTQELARLHKRGELKGEDDVRAAMRSKLLENLQGSGGGDPTFEENPTVILVVGVNGSGKTTSIAKLAHRFQSVHGKKVILGAGDTFRAAAADQLEIWAQRNGADIVRQHKDNADPAAVAFDTCAAALARGADVAIIDTAGRLHTQSNLMQELEKVRRVIGRKIEGAPHETWLVIDGTNGQNAIRQAKEFTAAVDVTGLIVAKLDGTARGGAVFGIQRELDLPVRYIGTGESVELLEAFEPEPFVDAIVSKTVGAGAEPL